MGSSFFLGGGGGRCDANLVYASAKVVEDVLKVILSCVPFPCVEWFGKFVGEGYDI